MSDETESLTTFIENQYDIKVKVFQSKNAKKYICQFVEAFLQQKVLVATNPCNYISKADSEMLWGKLF